jgi:pyruvate dehydrogenase E2 component (dihydrolipoamide acetyltransferase)
MTDIKVKVPNIGDFASIEVIEIPIEVGQTVAIEDPLLVLESDKASMEVPSDAAGVVLQILVNVGDKVSEGTEIVVLSASEDASSEPEPPEAEASSEETSTVALTADKSNESPVVAVDVSTEQAPQSNEVAQVPRKGQSPAPISDEKLPEINQVSFVKAHASPSVRAFARELGVNLSNITGTGRKERITKDDVRQHIKAVMQGHNASSESTAQSERTTGIPPIPAVDFSEFGTIREEKLSRIQKISGPHLHRAWLNVPMVTQFDEADVTELEAFRKSLKVEAEKRGVKISTLAFVMKAVASALETFPQFNTSLSADGESLIYKDYINLGIAVDTPNGLMVPVFKDVPNKSIYTLSEELADISSRAREGKIRGHELKGGTFSISSLGGIGGTAFTPIVNAPEVAILGLSRNQIKPVWNGSEFAPRTMLPLSLSYDHRVIDGANGARFVVHLSALLGDIRRTLL